MRQWLRFLLLAYLGWGTSFQMSVTNGGKSSRKACIAQIATGAGVFLTAETMWDMPAKANAEELKVQQGNGNARDLGAIFRKAAKKATGGGASGASAAVVQVLTLMPARTVMNSQYRYGLDTSETVDTLYKEGGIPRFYKGLPFALAQGPLSRFGDVAANALVLVLLDSLEETRDLPLPIKSAGGSIAAGLWRVLLMPIDTLKTTMQVSGSQGIPDLKQKIATNGPSVLYEGALATSLATFVGHYPWYFTYNYLSCVLPQAAAGAKLTQLLRNAFLGTCSSCVSDLSSNSVRVIKTTKQTSPVQIGYGEALEQVLTEGGLRGLFGRGLKTRLAVNAVQGAVFTVCWKYFESILI
ncbi:unnamed protein product [Chrysoparadoxa australica]